MNFADRLGHAGVFISLLGVAGLTSYVIRVVLRWFYVELYIQQPVLTPLTVLVVIVGFGAVLAGVGIRLGAADSTDGDESRAGLASTPPPTELEAVREEASRSVNHQVQAALQLRQDAISVFKLNLLIASIALPGVSLLLEANLIATPREVFTTTLFDIAAIAWGLSVLLSIFAYGLFTFTSAVGADDIETAAHFDGQSYQAFLAWLVATYRDALSANATEQRVVTMIIGAGMTYTTVSIFAFITAILRAL